MMPHVKKGNRAAGDKGHSVRTFKATRSVRPELQASRASISASVTTNVAPTTRLSKPTITTRRRKIGLGHKNRVICSDGNGAEITTRQKSVVNNLKNCTTTKRQSKCSIANTLKNRSTDNNLNNRSAANNAKTRSAANNLNNRSAANNVKTRSAANNLNNRGAVNDVNTRSAVDNLNNRRTANNLENPDEAISKSYASAQTAISRSSRQHGVSRVVTAPQRQAPGIQRNKDGPDHQPNLCTKIVPPKEERKRQPRAHPLPDPQTQSKSPRQCQIEKGVQSRCAIKKIGTSK